MDSFFGIGIMELFFIAVVAMLVLGPERLPGAIREVAKYIRMLRGLTSDLTSQFSEELKMLDEINPQKLLNELTAPLENESKSAAKAAPKTPSKAAAPKPSTTTAAKPIAKTTTKPAVTTKKDDAAQDKATGVADSDATNLAPSAEPENRILPPGAEMEQESDTQPVASGESAPPAEAKTTAVGAQTTHNGAGPAHHDQESTGDPDTPSNADVGREQLDRADATRPSQEQTNSEKPAPEISGSLPQTGHPMQDGAAPDSAAEEDQPLSVNGKPAQPGAEA